MKQLEEAIKNRPSHTWIRNNLDKAEEIDWAFVKIQKEFNAFEKKLRALNLKEWLEKHKLQILQRFELHSVSGLTPEGVLQFLLNMKF